MGVDAVAIEDSFTTGPLVAAGNLDTWVVVALVVAATLAPTTCAVGLVSTGDAHRVGRIPFHRTARYASSAAWQSWRTCL
ncbi:hypothetical protein [Curtobacterium sp. ME12]|uniref:hypothetical protein n=1 Tax=Curtobacterium sp. ME12 TaxID=2744253 RepID=UPI0015F3D99D|nr:hypothetical protein [Curtobacterium sp. ME12]